MLPSPATTRWSSSAALIGVALPARARDSTAGVKASPSGSGPSPARRRCESSAAVGTRSTIPKRRGSQNPTRQPSSVSITRCSCRSGAAPRASEAAPCGPREETCGAPSCRATMRPDMPRWTSIESPVESRISMYFARRRNPSTRAPVRRIARSGGKGQRSPARRVSARAMVRPVSTAERPRITVSTSGSSGISSPVGRTAPPPGRRAGNIRGGGYPGAAFRSR